MSECSTGTITIYWKYTNTKDYTEDYRRLLMDRSAISDNLLEYGVRGSPLLRRL